MNSTNDTMANRFASWFDRSTATVFLMPAILVVLVMSVFPLLVSLYLALSRVKIAAGGFDVSWVGTANFKKLLFGREQRHLLGKIGEPTLFGWVIFAVVAALLAYSLVRIVQRNGLALGKIFGRIITSALVLALVWLVIHTFLSAKVEGKPTGLPGTLLVTLFFVFGGVTLQYLIGLGLAMLATQDLAGKRFFRVVFLLPMMITPVGVAYLFRMVADTSKGPLVPLFDFAGLSDYAWAASASGARMAVLLADVWQWTPFIFIVLIAALEGQSKEQIEAALVDGANSLQVFLHITWPQILPVSTTVILIRIIEAFKIIDLPQVMTNGGPGTATETLTLQAYNAWKSLDFGGSAAVAYLLLFVVTFVGLNYVNAVRSDNSGAVA